ESQRAGPARFHLIDQDRNLLIREVAAGTLGERWHQGLRHAVGDHLAELLLADYSQEKRIVERAGSAHTAVIAMTARAVGLVECCEVRDLIRHHKLFRTSATACEKDCRSQEPAFHSRYFSCGPPCVSRSNRSARGRFCIVAIFAVRAITCEAARPNA